MFFQGQVGANVRRAVALWHISVEMLKVSQWCPPLEPAVLVHSGHEDREGGHGAQPGHMGSRADTLQGWSGSTGMD